MTDISGLNLLASVATEPVAPSPSSNADDLMAVSSATSPTETDSSTEDLHNSKRNKQSKWQRTWNGKHDTMKSYKLACSVFIVKIRGLDKDKDGAKKIDEALKEVDEILKPDNVLTTRAVPESLRKLAPEKSKDLKNFFKLAAKEYRKIRESFSPASEPADPILSLILEQGLARNIISKATVLLFIKEIEPIREKLTDENWAKLIIDFSKSKHYNYHAILKRKTTPKLKPNDYVQRAIKKLKNESNSSFDDVFKHYKKEIISAIEASFMQDVSSYRGKHIPVLPPPSESLAQASSSSTSSSASSVPFPIDSSSIVAHKEAQNKFMKAASNFFAQLNVFEIQNLVQQLATLWKGIHNAEIPIEETATKLAEILEENFPNNADISEGIYPLAHDYLTEALPNNDSDEDVDEVEAPNVSHKRRADEMANSENNGSHQSHKKQKTTNSENSESQGGET